MPFPPPIGLVVLEGTLVVVAVRKDPLPSEQVVLVPLPSVPHCGGGEDIGAFAVLLPVLPVPGVHVFVGVGVEPFSLFLARVEFT